MIKPLEGIKALIFKTQWRGMLHVLPLSRSWFWRMHLPYMLKYAFQSLYMHQYKTYYYNSRIYDGQTRNDFIKGELISFLGKLDAIRKYNFDEDPDGRWYWIGNLDDE
jgi:hypothetical protein